MNWHDAADAKLDLWNFWQSPAGEKTARYFYLSVASKHAAIPDSKSHDTYEHIQELELISMYRAEPIWVAPEIMEIAEAASLTFRPESFETTDLITPHGFVCASPQALLHARRAGEDRELPSIRLAARC